MSKRTIIARRRSFTTTFPSAFIVELNRVAQQEGKRKSEILEEAFSQWQAVDLQERLVAVIIPRQSRGL